MKKISKLFLIAAACIFAGQGCLNFGGGGNAADGSMWRSADAGAKWHQLATLPEAGGIASLAGVNVSAFAIDPSDASVYYMGTEANGLFYSLDAGNSWTRPKAEVVRSGAIIDVQVHPTDVCTVYVLKATQLIKSTNCMRTFTVAYTEARNDVTLRDFALDWFNPSVIWLGSSGGDILKSMDAGSSWTTLTRARDGITAIAVSAADSRIVMVGTEDHGMLRSVNAGADWTDMESELRKQFRDSDEVYGFVQTRDGRTILMNTQFGILRSTDQGATWSALPIIVPGRDLRIWSVAIDPLDANTIYYATVGALYASSSGGASWETRKVPSTRAPRTLIVHPSAKTNILAGFATLAK